MRGGTVKEGVWRSRRSHAFDLALLATLVVALLRFCLGGLLGSEAPLITFALAVAVAASYGGFGSGICATLLSGLVGNFLFMEPRYRISISEFTDQVQLAVFGSIGLAISLIGDRMRRALRASQKDREALKRATQKTEESLAELEAILGNMTECLVLSDPAGNVLSMNPAGRAMHDLTDPREIRQNLSNFSNLFEISSLDGRILPTEEWMLGRALAGETFSAIEVRIRNKRTNREWIASVGGTPVYNKQGELILAFITIRDITNQKRIEIEREMLLASERAARSEAERANRMKDEFVATVSHELRTPLNAILGWVQMLMRPARTEKDLGKGLAVIERNTRLQTQLINDLLDVSRIASGKLHMEMQTVELEASLQAALDVLRPAAEAKSISLCQAIDSKDLRVLGDPGRLQQVVWNLVSNAIKFTPKGGEVRVSLCQRGEKAALEVRDTGQGIEPEFVPHIFERFRQADSSMARKHGGLGLGLSIVKHIVEMHGGEVRAESEGLGKGATFVVELPLKPLTTERPGREWVKTDVRIDVSGLRVLVVDDEPDARELLERVLEEHEAKVVTAGSADEALSALEQQQFDMMVSDIGMPGMDGYALMREVRARALRRGDKCPPAIAVTAFARPEDRERALSAGYRLHLAKPIEPAELVASVAELAKPEAHEPPTILQ